MEGKASEVGGLVSGAGQAGPAERRKEPAAVWQLEMKTAVRLRLLWGLTMQRHPR